ncbi:hypothetical protein ENUP19_0159G0010 [Entamoeba nuttalli]|uniref:Uncharacterized protein n=1 Tax=Entamoeba nuttalli TaxID=412467 RepID=A0ABQ0DD41_9EUKA
MSNSDGNHEWKYDSESNTLTFTFVVNNPILVDSDSTIPNVFIIHNNVEITKENDKINFSVKKLTISKYKQ